MFASFMKALVKFMDIALVLSSYIWLAPYSKDFDIVLPCRVYAIIRLLWFSYNGRLNPTIHEIVLLAVLSIPSMIFFFVQSMVLQNIDCVKNGAGSILYLFTAYYIYKGIGVKKYFKYLFIFSGINILGIFIWITFGTPEVIPTPENGRSPYSYVLNFMTIKQSINYDMATVGNWFMKVRFCGFTSNQNTIGICSALGMLYLTFIKLSTKKMIAAWLGFAVLLLLTQSRAAFLFVMVFYITRYAMMNNLLSKKMLKLLGLISGLFIVGLFLNSLRDSGGDISSQRVFFMETLLKIYFDNNLLNQLFGIGHRQLHAFLWIDSGIDWLSPDNTYVPLLFENGIVGFGVLSICALFTAFYSCTRRRDGIKEGLPMILAIMALSFFERVWFISQSSYFYLIYAFYLTSIKCNKGVD